VSDVGRFAFDASSIASGVARFFPMKTPTHDDVALRAYCNWQSYGCPEGSDIANWFEAEDQLSAEASDGEGGAEGDADSGTLSESQSASAVAEQAALQRKEARAPIVPQHAAPNTRPPETGKPLWSKPHSS